MGPTYNAETGQWDNADGWTAEDLAELGAIRGEAIAEERRLEAARAATSAATASPAAVKALARAATATARQARQAEERRAEGERAWLAALDAYGADRLARRDTDEGDIFIQGAMSGPEVDAANQRAGRLKSAKAHAAIRAAQGAPSIEAMARAEAEGEAEATEAHRDAIIAKLVHPSAERAREFMKRKPAFWAVLYLDRDRMVAGERTAEGKDSAP